jgi:hypothetical protein
MKAVLSVFVTLAAALSAISSSSAHAQSYSINWYTIDGGGGTSTGGVYSVSGTIGQPDAGNLSGGEYKVVGGFWSFAIAVQQPDAPVLSIESTAPGSITVSWEPDTPGFVLQSASNPSAEQWADAGVDSTNPVVINTAPGFQFYRLFKP